MRRLFVFTAIAAVALAKPELYKEKEDFQYSRSSSDDGSKSGYYGAQRGNMGGNYEKAHNMDTLAQHQMGGLVNQIEGELGDGFQTKTGNVYTAGNSRGVYGSGHLDTSRLGGRNFQEGTTFGDTSSSLSSHNAGYSSSLHNAAYNSGYRQSQNSNYALHGQSGLASSNLQSIDAQSGTDSAGYGGYQTGHSSQSGYQRHSSSSSYGSDSQNSASVNSRLVGAGGAPVKVYIRPGTRVVVPVAVQEFDANAVNSEAESLNRNEIRTNIRPTSNAKHYESSYNYRKEWEKHDTIPEITTVNPYPINSELHDDTQYQNAAALHSSGVNSNSNSYNSRYVNSAAQSASSRLHNSGYHHNLQQEDISALQQQSGLSAQQIASMSASALQQQLEYNMQQQSALAASHASHGAISSNADSLNLGVNSNPKSYQSSYSYHKSWERQGDPYIIKPSTNGLYETQRLTDASSQASHSSHQYGSHHKSAHSSSYGVDDCDDEGHVRVARSYRTNFHQQPQLENLEDLGQQVQSNIDDFGQYPQSGKLEDLGQQTQTQWGNLENLNQQAQQSDKFEDLTQSVLQQSGKLENFGQQVQQQSDDKWENLSQQTQNHLSNLEDLGQQTQAQWSNWNSHRYNQAQDLQQHIQNLDGTPGKPVTEDKSTQSTPTNTEHLTKDNDDNSKTQWSYHSYHSNVQLPAVYQSIHPYHTDLDQNLGNPVTEDDSTQSAPTNTENLIKDNDDNSQTQWSYHKYHSNVPLPSVYQSINPYHTGVNDKFPDKFVTVTESSTPFGQHFGDNADNPTVHWHYYSSQNLPETFHNHHYPYSGLDQQFRDKFLIEDLSKPNEKYDNLRPVSGGDHGTNFHEWHHHETHSMPEFHHSHHHHNHPGMDQNFRDLFRDVSSNPGSQYQHRHLSDGGNSGYFHHHWQHPGSAYEFHHSHHQQYPPGPPHPWTIAEQDVMPQIYSMNTSAWEAHSQFSSNNLNKDFGDSKLDTYPMLYSPDKYPQNGNQNNDNQYLNNYAGYVRHYHSSSNTNTDNLPSGSQYNLSKSSNVITIPHYDDREDKHINTNLTIVTPVSSTTTTETNVVHIIEKVPEKPKEVVVERPRGDIGDEDFSTKDTTTTQKLNNEKVNQDHNVISEQPMPVEIHSNNHPSTEHTYTNYEQSSSDVEPHTVLEQQFEIPGDIEHFHQQVNQEQTPVDSQNEIYQINLETFNHQIVVTDQHVATDQQVDTDQQVVLDQQAEQENHIQYDGQQINLDQQFESLGPHENLDQQVNLEQQFDNFEHSNQDQQQSPNTEHKPDGQTNLEEKNDNFELTSQNHQNLDNSFQSLEHQSFDEIPSNIDQQQVSLDQQSMHPGYGQISNANQQLQNNIGQTNNFDQQKNVEPFVQSNLDQQQVPLEQQPEEAKHNNLNHIFGKFEYGSMVNPKSEYIAEREDYNKKNNSENDNFVTNVDHQQVNLQNQYQNIKPHKHNVDQKPTEIHPNDLSQQVENSHNGHEINFEQQFENNGQNENFDQQVNLEQQFENFEQTNFDQQQANHQYQSLEPLQSFDQKDTEKQLVDLGQQVEDIGQFKNIDQAINLEQQFEKFDKSQLDQQHLENLEHFEKDGKVINFNHPFGKSNTAQLQISEKELNGDQKHTYVKPHETNTQSEPVEIINKKHLEPLNKEPEIPEEVATEKPGFWNKVGGMVSNTKKKVSSWLYS